MWEAARKWMDENGYRGEALDSCDDDLNPDKPCPPPAAAESTPNRIRRSSPAPPMFLHPRFQPPRPPNPRDPFANMEGGLGTGYPGLHDVRQMTKSTSSSSFGIQTPEARGVEPRGLTKSGSAASCPGRDKKPIRRTNTVSFSTNTEKPVPDGVSVVSRASSVFNRGRAVDDAAVGSSNSMRSPEVTSDADSARSTDRSSCKIRRAATTGTKIGSPLNPCMRLRPPAVRSALTWLHSQLESPDDEVLGPGSEPPQCYMLPFLLHPRSYVLDRTCIRRRRALRAVLQVLPRPARKPRVGDGGCRDRETSGPEPSRIPSRPTAPPQV